MTVGSNTDRGLIVTFGAGNGNTDVDCTYNSVAMTLDVDRQTTFDDFGVSSLIAPDTGAHTLECGSGETAEVTLAWLSVYNMAQEGAESICDSITGTGSSKTCTPAIISTGSLVQGGIKLDRSLGSPIAGSGLTLQFAGSNTSLSAYGIEPTAWTITNMQSNGQKRGGTASYKEVSGATRRFIMMN